MACWLCGETDPDWQDVFGMWAHEECVIAFDEAFMETIGGRDGSVDPG